jgi:hypothetical protein
MHLVGSRAMVLNVALLASGCTLSGPQVVTDTIYSGGPHHHRERRHSRTPKRWRSRTAKFLRSAGKPTSRNPTRQVGADGLSAELLDDDLMNLRLVTRKGVLGEHHHVGHGCSGRSRCASRR